MDELLGKARRAREASHVLAGLGSREKDEALQSMAGALERDQADILAANRRDCRQAEEAGLSGPLLRRLRLDEDKVRGMAEGLRQLAALPDPLAEGVRSWRRPNGLEIHQVRVPLGVIGLIYESRPNVTVDAAGICLKSGNAVILRGGTEALHSNRILVEVVQEALAGSGAPADAVQLIADPDRAVVHAMMQLNGLIDCLIPRGGASLIRAVVENSTVPVIETGVGNCHVYVDRDADLEMARRIVFNAKVSNPGVCNAAEKVLIHRDVAAEFLRLAGPALTGAGVELRGDAESMAYWPEMKAASEDDWSTEYLDLIMGVKIVSDWEEAVEHIRRYGSGHSEAIVTENYTTARHFLQAVDAAAVYVNASTRFTDGGEFGFGAEIGISTQKLHVRGPMGLEHLTATKYLVYGQGQVR